MGFAEASRNPSTAHGITLSQSTPELHRKYAMWKLWTTSTASADWPRVRPSWRWAWVPRRFLRLTSSPIT